MATRSLLVRGVVLPAAVVPASPASGVVRVAVEGDRFAAFTPETDARAAVDHDGLLLPGFIDLQVNGGGGRDVGEATPAALQAVADACWAGGTVAFLPTLITAPFDVLCDRLARVAAWIDDWRGTGAEPLGIHLEGPFLEVAGAHDESLFLDPTPGRIDALLAAARGRLALVTLAPGRRGAPDAVARLRAAGVAVALGHARSTEQLDACVSAGATLVTHLFNAMGPMHHRDPGLAILALDDPRLSCSLICDGAHVHPAVVRTAFAALGPARTVLVTDAAAPAGCPDGSYRLGDQDVIARAGIVRRPDGTLAGSALTMAHAARHFRTVLGHRCGPWTLAQVASTNAARILGRTDRGRLVAGARAEGTILHADGTCTAWRVGGRDDRVAR